MANQFRNPQGVAPPVGAYSHSVEVPAGSRTLHIAGQVGVSPDGRLAAGLQAQTETALENLVAVLAAAGMEIGDVVKVTLFVVKGGDLAAVREARSRVFGDHRPASTLVFVEALAGPEYLIEVEATAARA